MAAQQEKIDELETTIKGLKNLIRVTQSNLENPNFVARSIADREKTIEKLQREINQMRDTVSRGPDIIHDAKTRIIQLRKAVVLLQHSKQIEQLKKLKGQIELAESSS